MKNEIGKMINFDHHRKNRVGLPESVYCRKKPIESIQHLIVTLSETEDNSPILFTRLAADVYDSLGAECIALLDYHPLSETAFLNGTYSSPSRKSVAIITAGTSDSSVAWEAARTLEHSGVKHDVFEDLGVAGLWRLEERIKDIEGFDILIVVAGMDAALCSVVGGLSGKPVIGVPTSTGYGVADGGKSALNSMLTSCASGVLVVNIDNGYGAASAAIRIINGAADGE